jgi:hypothetical protein
VTDQLAVGMCVCGQHIPTESPSDWACSEQCQSAWLHHQADPQYPHPREIRQAAEARLAQAKADLQRQLAPPRRVPDGVRVTDDDGGTYVRVGGAWMPVGMWGQITPGHAYYQLAAPCWYRRWCPTCRGRRQAQVHTDGDTVRVQVCDTCGHRWDGRPLHGIIETRGEPWPALRLRLTDGYRSAAWSCSEQEIHRSGTAMPERMARAWLRLERQLGGGYCDADQPNQAQRARAERRRHRDWDTPDRQS